MEDNEFYVDIVTDKKYFIEDTVNIFFRFNKKSLKSKYSDWIALYKCNSNRNLEEFVAVVTDLTIRSPNKLSLNPVTFFAFQLKNVKCNLEYEFIYGNKYNEICGISSPVRFIHKNDCTLCYPSVTETNHCSNCVSQELINSLLARISVVDNQLGDCKIQSNEIISMNKRLLDQMNKCEVIVQKNNQFLDNLFFTDEPVTKDGYRWMQPCSDTDLKMSLISSQEQEIQDLSNQNYGFKKVLEKFTQESRMDNCFQSQTDNNNHIDMDTNMLDSTVNVECGFIPKPSTATFVFIDSDEDNF